MKASKSRTKRTGPRKPVTVPKLDPKAIGRRIASTRKKRGWRIKDLAIASGLGLSSVGAYEVGHRIPCTAALVALATALRRKIDWMLLGRRESLGRSSRGVS